jgi:hypothetical protein
VRSFILLAFLAGAVCLAPLAHASVSFTVVLDALVSESSASVVATPISAQSLWEDGRIATYTKVHVERAITGTVNGDVWIRTLGGAVGVIGQQVEGEAVLNPGKTSLLFLKWYSGNFVVTARGQGQFVVLPGPSGALVVHKNLHAGALLGPNPTTVAQIQTNTTAAHAVLPAADVLDGKSVDDAATEIAAAWARTHAAP